jgi:hypothetical protein
MIKITDTIYNFDDLQNRCWGQAISVLDEIYNADKEDELLEHLEEVFADETPTLTEINDYISYEWEDIYKAINMTDNFEYDDNLVISLLHSNIDNLREMGHDITEPNDADLDYIFLEISKETYADEDDLDAYIYDLILTHLGENEDDDN